MTIAVDLGCKAKKTNKQRRQNKGKNALQNVHFFVANRMFISDSCKYACASLQLTPQRLVRGASSGLRGCRGRRSSKIGRRIHTLKTTFLLTSMPVFSSKFAVQIKCHSKTLERFKERRWGERGHERLSQS